MTRLDEVTGSPDRSTAVLEMVAEAIRDGDPSFEAVAAKVGPRIADKRLNKTFVELYEDEFQIALDMLRPAEFDPADVQVERVEGAAVIVAPESATITDPDVSVMTRDEANAELRRRQEAHMAARKARMIAEADQERCRKAMEAATMEWVRGGPSSDEIRRREIQAINADRRNKVEHDNQRHPGRSVIDREAFYRGDASTFARKQHRFGSHHRATALTEGGLLQRPGQRGTKLPSER